MTCPITCLHLPLLPHLRMSYEYDPISRPYPVCSTRKLLEKESSLMSFQDFELLDFLQNPLLVPSSGSLSSVSRIRKGKTHLEEAIHHPLPSSCQDISETSSDEEEGEEEVKGMSRKTEITTTKRSTLLGTTTERSTWPRTTTERSTRLPEFKPKEQSQFPRHLSPFSCQHNSLANLSSEGVRTPKTGGTRKEIGRGGRRRRKRLPRLSPRASHLLQVSG